MKRDLVEGYLFEVTKSLPGRDRKEIYEKLSPEIYEKIELNKKNNIETKEEVLEVLKEYGDPADIAANYSRRSKRALVPQPHYAGYNRNKFLSYLVAILSLAGVNGFIQFILKEIPVTIDEFLRVGFDIGSALLTIYVTYTLSYSLVSSGRVGNWDRFARSLKAEPSKSARIGIFEIIFQIILSALLFSVFGLSAEVLGINYGGILIGEYRVNMIVPIFLTYFLNVINIAAKEIDRRYTFNVFLTTIITNISVVALAFLIFLKDEAISSDFIEWLTDVLPANDITLTLIPNLGPVIFVIVVIFAIIDIISSGLGHHANNKSGVLPISKSEEKIEDKEGLYTSKEDSYQTAHEFPIVGDESSELDDFEKTQIIKPLEEVEELEPVEPMEDLEATRIINAQELEEELFETKVISKAEMEVDQVEKEKPFEEQKPKTIADYMRENHPDNQ